MAADEAREDACRDYQSSLEDLTFNSKPHINMLTILAEENVQFARDIVTLIEAQIAKAPSTEKLPVMYLMDSIVKNVGRNYQTAFAKNIVSTFVNVFEKVDENTRKSLYKLRSTWDEIFPSKKLYALDVRVQQVDPAWPIKPLPPNINSPSIHVNPKFLNKSDEASKSATPAPKPAPVPKPAPAPRAPPVVAEVQKSALSQEQVIRQQLLMKQKQLLELQQKKLELELEQTKAQLASSSSSVSAPTKPEVPQLSLKTLPPPSTHSDKGKSSVPPQPIEKPAVPTRDPRLNRNSQHSTHSKDQGSKKDVKANLHPPEPKAAKPAATEKVSSSTKQEKSKTSEKLSKKESVHTDHKGKAKSPSPMKAKVPHAKDSKSTDSDASKRDPRIRKHIRDKADEKPEEIKEKRRSTEKKEDHKSSEHRQSGNRSKIANGIQKSEPSVNAGDKQTTKPSRGPGRKRSRSRSPKTRSPVLSPKRRDRRSPAKRRQRSLSPIPSLLKPGKVRQPGGKLSHSEEFPPSTRDERSKRIPKMDARDSRRQKKSSEERSQDPATQTSMRSSSEPKENVANWQESKASKRWRPSWEDSKTSQSGDHHQGNRTPHARHRDSWSNKGMVSPRTPKQQAWLSVDANLKIPKELTSASKGELLKKANERLTSGEISQDEFLVVAHQICQLFQYQEEKERYSVWDSPTDDTKGGRKKPLLSNAELNYYEHKAKLRRTQVQHFMDGFLDMDEMDLDSRGSELEELIPRGMSPETRPLTDELLHDIHRRHDDQRELSTGLREEQRPSYNEQFPPKRSRYDEAEQIFDDKARIGKDGVQHVALLDERRPLLDSPSLLPGPSGKGFEDPINVLNARVDSPAKSCTLFEEPSGLRADPLFDNELVDTQRFDNLPGPPINQLVQRFEGPNLMVPNPPIGNQMMEVLQDSPLGPPRFEGPQSRHMGGFDGPPGAPSRFDGLQPVEAARFEGGLGPQRFDTGSGLPNFESHQRFEGPQRFDGGGLGPGTQRFDGVLGPQRFDGGLGPQRFDGGLGPQRFDGPTRPLLQQRFEGPHNTPMRFEQPVRFDTIGGQPMRFDGPHGPRFDTAPNVRFDGPPGPRFDGPRFDGLPGPRFDGPLGAGRFDPSPQPIMRFDGPMGQNIPRFENPQVHRFENQPLHVPRFDVIPGQPCQRFDGPPGHQTPPRFDGPIQMQQQRFEGLMPQRFDGPNPQPRFDGPNPQPRFDGPNPPLRFDGLNPPPRFDVPVVHPGPRFDNLSSTPIRQNVPPFGQTVPFEQQNMFPGQFQRPDQRFDLPQGPGFSGPPAPGVQGFPNQLSRPAGPFFDDKNPQGPGFGHFNMPGGNLPPNPPFQPMDGMAQPAPFTQEPLPAAQMPPNTGVFPPSQPAPTFPNPENHLGQLDVNELFSKLLSTGILKASQTENTSSQATEPSTQSTQEEEEEDPSEDQDVPDLTSFPMEDLKHRYESVIVRLYTGIQCYSCGMRFTKSQTDVYADHLDWHYRQNRTEKDVSRKITHRRWYYSLKDWIEFEEIADLEERAKSQFFEKVHEEVILKTQEAAKEKEFQSVPAGPAGADEICDICKEQFEQYWDEEEEEWHLKNAMRVNEKIFHPSCYEDYKNTSSFLDCSPSPSKTLTENPLNAMLRLVKEEVADTSDSTVRVKEEPNADDAAAQCAQSIPLLTEIKPEAEDDPV
ncbi:pre-mRNA cleavage complex 2 protein Pcf11 [Anomaloglossus baeobatrachus]|uniref:pre-mRNA cleavage complex 2 protein Pcf11 n=1 Tax=Anomaloglossus baeobatrachus TaxID=238106 RepID=UPI003F502715